MHIKLSVEAFAVARVYSCATNPTLTLGGWRRQLIFWHCQAKPHVTSPTSRLDRQSFEHRTGCPTVDGAQPAACQVAQNRPWFRTRPSSLRNNMPRLDDLRPGRRFSADMRRKLRRLQIALRQPLCVQLLRHRRLCQYRRRIPRQLLDQLG